MSDQARTYTVATIHDILQIPAGRRDAFWSELRLALDLYEFAIGDEPSGKFAGLDWTDDGELKLDVSLNAEHVLSLHVTEGAQP